MRYIHDRCPTIGETEIRKVLGALGLQTDSHTRPIEKLSGGEKSRVVLAELSLNQYNVLFLDEPTNHLDTASAKAVAEAVVNFEGAVLAISSRRLFCRSSCHTQLHSVSTTRCEVHIGFDPKHLVIQQSQAVKKVKASNAEEHKERKKLRNQIKRWEREYEELENQIMELEEQIEELDAKMFEAASGFKAAPRPSPNQKNAAEDTLEKSMERWEELGEQLAEHEE